MSISSPRQVILVSTESNVDFFGGSGVKEDIVAVAWHMPVSKEPMLYAIALAKSRYSLKLIRGSKVFIINFLPWELKEEALFCGRNSGAHIDKFKGAKLTREEGKTVHAPRIKEALGYLECEVVNEIDGGDHVIIIGKVLHSEEKRTGKRVFHLGGDEFTTTMR